MNTDPLTKQIGGTHYKKKAIQPVEFWQRNRWDGCACSILKYLARYRDKNGVEDLKKARHFVELRQQFERHLPISAPPTSIPMIAFITANGITYAPDMVALQALEGYVHAAPQFRDAHAERLIECIDDLILRWP